MTKGFVAKLPDVMTCSIIEERIYVKNFPLPARTLHRRVQTYLSTFKASIENLWHEITGVLGTGEFGKMRKALAAYEQFIDEVAGFLVSEGVNDSLNP